MRAIEQNKRILIMFNSGFAPSEIDREMSLVRGSARRVIVAAWSYDKESSRSSDCGRRMDND